MVSRRYVSHTFTEGERVLCYEPDPTKAKVLYSSKVLKVHEEKGKRGRKMVKYLIHFNGWNSSWDRFVSQDYILKDTPNNRKLQWELADKSRPQSSQSKKRRCKERRFREGKQRKGSRYNYDNETTSSTQEDESDAGDTDFTSCSEGGVSSEHGRAPIVIPESIRKILTFDCHQITKQKNLCQLPATPCVADILEDYVTWYIQSGAWLLPQAGFSTRKPNIRSIAGRLNVTFEVMDGLRVYFDTVLGDSLLYNEEIQQFNRLCGYIKEENKDVINIKQEKTESNKVNQVDYFNDKPGDIKVESDIKLESNIGGMGVFKLENSSKVETLGKVEVVDNIEIGGEIIRVGKMEKVENIEMGGKVENVGKLELENMEVKDMLTLKMVAKIPHLPGPSLGTDQIVESSSPVIPTRRRSERITKTSETIKPTNIISNVIAMRRLRSQSNMSLTSECVSDDCRIPTCCATTSSTHMTNNHCLINILDDMTSSVSSGSNEMYIHRYEYWTPRKREEISKLLEKVKEFSVIPRDAENARKPCRIYGGVHLARLFVQLPQYLDKSDIPDGKLEVLLICVANFLEFLNNNRHYFKQTYCGENFKGAFS